MALPLLLMFLIQTPAVCNDVPDCRSQALAARAAGDFERFHDLAWRAVQKSKTNDPELMFLLARAQSLSGRPDDALVMLGRLADIGFVRDISVDEDFARVRRMPKWPELEERLRAIGSSASAPSVLRRDKPDPSALSRRSGEAAEAELPSTHDFDPSDVDPVGLARDVVSRRLVLGDRKNARLLVIDDLSHHVVNLVSAKSAGFYKDVTGFAIDDRRGDLWVVSTEPGDAAQLSRLHKLQLVSGRVLEEIEAPPGSRLAGVGVAPDGVVYAIDAADARLLRLRVGSRTLDPVVHIQSGTPSAIAVADDRTVYVAAGDDVVHVDTSAHTVIAIKGRGNLGGIESLTWHAGALICVQRRDAGPAIVRAVFDPSGTRVVSTHVLATDVQDDSPIGATGSSVYYLQAPGKVGHVDIR
jgi:hypothetical protein